MDVQVCLEITKVFCFQFDAFKKRMEVLNSHVEGSNYGLQKSALVNDFQEFLQNRCGKSLKVSSRELNNADPEDVVKFLVDRDSRGRTQAHGRGCKFLGARGIRECGCAVTLAEGTVDSYIG